MKSRNEREVVIVKLTPKISVGGSAVLVQTPMTEVRKCSTCGIRKPETEFYNYSKYRCKSCHRVKSRLYKHKLQSRVIEK